MKRKMKKWMAMAWLVSLLLMAVVGLAQADGAGPSVAPGFRPSTTLENLQEIRTSKENNSSGSAVVSGQGTEPGQAKSVGGLWGWLSDHGKGLLYGLAEGVVVAAGVVAVGTLLTVSAPVLAVAAGAAVLGAAAYGLFTGAERFNVWECGGYSLIAAVSGGVGQGLAAAGLAGRGLAVARAAVDVVGGGLASVGSYLLHSPHPTWGGAAEAFGVGAATAGLFLGLGYGWGTLKAALGFSGGSAAGSGSAAMNAAVANAAERSTVEAGIRVTSKPAALERARGTVAPGEAPVIPLGQEAPRPFVQSKPSSSKLAGNMIAAGVQRPPDTAAHHIVAGTDKRAALARQILERYGVDINDEANGVFLPNFKSSSAPGVYHRTLHTNRYYAEVNALLQKATTKEEVLDVLDYIRDELLHGTFPH